MFTKFFCWFPVIINSFHHMFLFSLVCFEKSDQQDFQLPQTPSYWPSFSGLFSPFLQALHTTVRILKKRKMEKSDWRRFVFTPTITHTWAWGFIYDHVTNYCLSTLRSRLFFRTWCEIDWLEIGFTVFRRKLSRKAKLPTIICVHKRWVMTERIRQTGRISAGGWGLRWGPWSSLGSSE